VTSIRYIHSHHVLRTKAPNKSSVADESDRSLFIGRCEVCVYSGLEIIGCRMNISFRIRE
jgi:hypothetical protein